MFAIFIVVFCIGIFPYTVPASIYAVHNVSFPVFIFFSHGCMMHVTVRAILADCVFSIDKASATRRHSIYDISR